MIHPLKLVSSSLLSLGLLAALPAHADEDTFTLRVGAIQAKAETQFSASTQFNGDTYDYDSERFDLGDDTSPRIEGSFHFADRHRVLFNYFQYDKTNRVSLGQDVSFDDVTIPEGSTGKFKSQFDLASVLYDYALVETPNVSFGLQVGAEWARLKARASASDGTNSFSAQASESGTAPVVGARFAAHTADQRWGFVVQGQYLDAEWGNFDDYSGDLSRANALVEYRFTRNVGVYAGYDWFKLDVKQSGSDGRVGIDQRFSGPMAGLTFAF